MQQVDYQNNYNTMNHLDIIRAFGFQLASNTILKSIYPYAPVYHMHDNNGQWIIKRTRAPLAMGQVIARWTQSLATNDIKVVTPATGFGQNPRSFWDNDKKNEETWVVYPFITGLAYNRKPKQLLAAGELLGKIHAVGMNFDCGLKCKKTIVAADKDDVEEDIETISTYLSTYFPTQLQNGLKILQQRSNRYFEQILPKLLQISFPLTNCTWDYKASNLIYQTDTSPVLIDPDNGGRIPRIYDLAIAALLFHNEGLADSVLTRSEWLHFLEGYFRYSQLTKIEQDNWADILLSAWIDEAVWLLGDDKQGWADPVQSKMLLSLLIADLSNFYF